jgi:hypothetical protein
MGRIASSTSRIPSTSSSSSPAIGVAGRFILITDFVVIPNHTYQKFEVLRWDTATSGYAYADGSDLNKIGTFIILAVGGAGVNKWVRLSRGAEAYDVDHSFPVDSFLYLDPGGTPANVGKLITTRPGAIAGQNIIQMGYIPRPNVFVQLFNYDIRRS